MKIKIGIIGLGTVGSSVIKLLKQNSKLITEHTGMTLEVAKAADVRDKRSVAGKAYTKNAKDVINDPEISIVVETMGGVMPAKKFALAAIKAGKHFVTSNKELIAKHGRELIKEARKSGVFVLYEGSVCGGIPILHALRQSLSANRIEEVSGIVNGTTNYILTKMTNEGLSFNEALKQAQAKGYAEADPTMDIDGSDAAYKAAILASIIGGSFINVKDVYKEGIQGISREDIEYAKEIGYVIKLLAIIKSDNGKLEVRVHPTLIERSHPLAKVSDNYNAVFIKSNALGSSMLYGQGAGGMPTASAVMSDIIEIAGTMAGCCDSEPFYQKEKTIKLKDISDIRSRYYIRLQAPDKPGVLAGISGVFAKKKISIQEVVQRESKGKSAQIVVILHENREKDVQEALKAISRLKVVKKISSVIRAGIG